MSKEEGMEEKSAKQSSEEEEEEDSKTPQLFPLFPFQQPHAPLQIETSTTTTTITTTNSDNPQWLSNTSFTTDLSVVHHSVSSLYKDLPTITNQPEEENEVPDKAPSQQPSYTILDSPKSSSSSDETEKSRRKKKRRKTKHRSKSRDSPLDPNKYYSTSRKAGVSAWAGSDTKTSSKDYYFDSRGDRDNLAFGSLYRMDVARYKSLNYTTKSHFSNQWKNWDSVLDGDRDIDALDGKLRSGGRYWSSKYSVLERHKGFKRLRIVASPFISESSEFVPFSDVDDESQVEKSVLEESWEEEVLRRTREFNKMSRESPHDENVWLAFAEFQDKIASRQPQKGARLQTLEKKISILEKATELNPDNEELLLHLMKAYQKRDSTDVLTERWEKVLVQHSGSYKMWSEFLRVIQCDFSKFKVSEMRKMYAHAIQALSAARGRLYRQMEIHQTIKSSSSETAVIQLELGLVDIFSSLCRLEWQSGYQELATALFQAELEYSLFCPSLLLTEQNKQRLFEHFWKGTNARLGEDGALGWSMWLEKEEENRQKVINEVSLQENEEGGWTGWSELPSKNDEATRSPKPLTDDVVVVNEDEEDSETEDIQEDDIESLLKKLGVDVDAEADHEVKDTATWGRWSEEELSRDSQQWMPLHEKSAGASDESPDKEVDDHLLRVILFEDITEHLFSLLSEEARLALVFQFIDFFGGRISKWVCTNSPSWKAKTLSLETLSDFILDDLRKIHETTNQVQSSSSNFSLNDLLGSPSDIPKGMGMMKFLRNAVLLCLSVFPRNHILEEAALVAEELFMTKMNSYTWSVTPSRALAKGLLKNDRQDLLLCGIYARHEAAFGNIDLARKVFDMALSSIDGLPLDHRSNAPLLYHWYAEMELSNCLAGGLGSCAMRAMHILSCLGTGMKYSTFNSQPSSVQLLRARQGFKEQIGTLRGAWVRGDIKDESVALICSAALFEELTTGWASAIAVLEEAFSMVLPERRRQSLQLESLFNYYIQILQKHCSRSRPSRVWASILQGLQIYPCSPKLFAAFVETGCIYTVPNKLRWIFDEYCQKKPSVIVWLFALSYEFSKAASLHRIHALFEKALTNDKLHDSVILWRCYIAYEIEIACNPSAARRIFYRAINACPWSKKLWLDGFLKLNSIFTAKELSDLQEVMRDKELNLRTDIYEILLQDEIKS